MSDSYDLDRSRFPAYEFKNGRVYRGGKRLRVRTNPGTGYRHYRLRRDDGKQICVAEQAVAGRMTKSGDLYFVSETPPGARQHPNWPRYVFNYETRRIWCVAWRAPRVKVREIRPNALGIVRLENHRGEAQFVKLNDIFGYA